MFCEGFLKIEGEFHKNRCTCYNGWELGVIK